jgi:phage shock protein A
VQSLPELESEYVLQKEATATLRQQLIKLESDVQKAYTKTRVLIARDKAARATEKANEILANSTSDGAMAIIERIEQRVLERQVQSELARDSHATGEAE